MIDVPKPLNVMTKIKEKIRTTTHSDIPKLIEKQSNSSFEQSNFYLFTGGPGAGKTTVLDELARQGFQVVPEVARAIIKHQNAIGGDATHNGDRIAYCNLMLKESIEDFIAKSVIMDNVFFDRGIPDLYSYSKRFCGGVNDTVSHYVDQFRYNALAFLFPPWADIYCHDTERKQDFQEAIDTYEAVKEGYRACGYQLVEVPKCSIADRIEFILNVMSQQVVM